MNLYPTPTVAAIAPIVSVTASGNGTGVDLKDFIGGATFILNAKNTAGTAPKLDVKLEGSDDNATGWAAIPGAAFAQVTDAAAVDGAVLVVDLDNAPRYVRAVDTVAGTSSPAFMRSVSVVGYKQRY